jgi:hypothetical protein
MAEDYARALTAQAIAKTGVALGIKSASSSVLECLSDGMHSSLFSLLLKLLLVTKYYIETIAANALEQAEIGGRDTPGVQDIITALSSTVFHCVLVAITHKIVHISETKSFRLEKSSGIR